MFKKILIANRGEIACRVMRTCTRLGVASVAVYSDADRHALHVQSADEAVHIGPAKASESYLNIERILTAAEQTGAEAVHPGYGFLSENADFARACKKAGLTFIGPDADSIDAMGSKSAAKTLMEKAAVPVVPGYHGDDQDPKQLAKEAERIGFPLMIKPAAGGGGKGMRVVQAIGEFKAALEGAQREAQSSFGDAQVLLERYVSQPRHIEVQVFGDRHGEVVHLFERECSLQRRFQKVLEETPSPFLDDALRRKMGAAAVAAAKAVKYVNAGTVEFIAGADKSFYFMEMNTRLQVEHPVTEETTRVDLVEWQLRVAAGERLPLTQEQIQPRGHAIEVRLYAENADKGFLPVTGRIERYEVCKEAYVRVDTGVRSGDDISIHYDPMLAKLTVRGKDRPQAVAHLRETLAQTAVFGLITNLPLLRGIAAHAEFSAGRFDTGFIERALKELLARPRLNAAAIAAAVARETAELNIRSGAAAWRADGWRLAAGSGLRLVARETDGTEHALRVAGSAETFTLYIDGSSHAVQAKAIAGDTWSVTVDGETQRADVLCQGADLQVAIGPDAFNFALNSPYAPKAGRMADEAAHPLSPMPGRVVAVHVKAGDRVEPGQPLLVLEGMKMEYTVKAAVAGSIEKVLYKEGEMVEAEAALVDIRPTETL